MEWIILHEGRVQGNRDDVGRKILRKILTYLPTKQNGVILQRIAVFIFTTKNTPNITRTRKVTFKMLAVSLCTCTATLWRVRFSIFVPWKGKCNFLLYCCCRRRSCQIYKIFQCCLGNVKMRTYLLYYCRATKYSAMLLTIICIKNYKCVCILALVIRHSDRTFC